MNSTLNTYKKRILVSGSKENADIMRLYPKMLQQALKEIRRPKRESR